MIKSLIFIFLFFKPLIAGEIDGKGLYARYMETQLVFFFEDNRAYEHKPKGGKEKLEIYKKEIGKYYTDENFIYFDDIKINRKTLSFQKYSSFRGECKAYKNMEDFKKKL